MDLFVLCTDTMAWRRQVTTGDGRPVARSDHCAVIDPDTERLVIFGGRSQVCRSIPSDLGDLVALACLARGFFLLQLILVAEKFLFDSCYVTGPGCVSQIEACSLFFCGV